MLAEDTCKVLTYEHNINKYIFYKKKNPHSGIDEKFSKDPFLKCTGASKNKHVSDRAILQKFNSRQVYPDGLTEAVSVLGMLRVQEVGTARVDTHHTDAPPDQGHVSNSLRSSGYMENSKAQLGLLTVSPCHEVALHY